MDPGGGGGGGGGDNHRFLATQARQEAAAIHYKVKPGAKAHVTHDVQKDFKKPFKVPATAFKDKNLIPGDCGRKKSSMKTGGCVNIDLDSDTWDSDDVWYLPKAECVDKELPEVTNYEMSDAERATPRRIKHILPTTLELK